jgi:phage terminase large subunit GpA-like protein
MQLAAEPTSPPDHLVKEIEIAPGIWIEVPGAPWNARDRAAWYWPQPMLASEWAEKYRRLDRGAIPGPWRNDNAPYLRGIMDLACRRGIERLTIKKAAQLGVSEGMRTLMGYWGHMDPAPMGLALPNRDKGREIVENDVMPFFKATFGRVRELQQLLSARAHDMKKGQIRLANSFILHLMWSGSPASLASNPMKRNISDEVDKFEAWSGNDADPISLIEYRMRTFPDRIHLLVSTPTVSGGPISQNFEASQTKLYFLIACPHCGTRQRLLFGEGGDYGVKWTDEVRQLVKRGLFDEAAAAVLQVQGACWYECCSCHGHISEQEKRSACRAGKWATVGDDHMTADGRIDDAEAIVEWPMGSWVGMHISSLYCCWESWTMAHVAAEFIRARTLSAKFAFRTSTLGEHWEQATETVDAKSIDTRVAEASIEEGVLPRWTARLVAVVDTQKDHFWLVIRAWGPGMRSQRVWHGRVESFEEIEQWCFKTPWRNEDPRLPAWTVDKVLIDSGGTRKFEEEAEGAPLPSRVMDVYAWVLKHQAHVTAIKGDARPEPGRYLRKGKGEYVTDKEKKPVPIWLLDVHHFHDELADMMGRHVEEIDPATGEVGKKVPVWSLNTRHDPEYHQHLSNMHKVQERTGRGADMETKWRPIRDGVRVDYRACEAYQIAGAYMTGVHLLPDMPTFMQAKEAELRHRTAPREDSRTLTTPDGRPFVAARR